MSVKHTSIKFCYVHTAVLDLNDDPNGILDRQSRFADAKNAYPDATFILVIVFVNGLLLAMYTNIAVQLLDVLVDAISVCCSEATRLE